MKQVPVLPSLDYQIRWPIGRRSLAITPKISEPGNFSLLQKAANAGGRENAIRLGRTWLQIPGRPWWHRDGKRRALSFGCGRCCAQTKRNTAAFHHNLFAPEHRRIRTETCRENAGRPQSLLFRQF